jgi:hypothetical protein
MTVLQKNEATGVDVGQLGRTLGKALLIGVIVVGVVFAVNAPSQPQGLSPAQIEEANALNIADIGRPQASIVVGGAAVLGGVDKADLLFMQRGAALADPADRIHKQKATEPAN